MKQALICIECPRGCALSVDVEQGKVITVSGEGCPKGKIYAVSEIENPLRILTSAVLAEGLALKMIPVRTDAGIPKAKLFEAMEAVKKIRVKKAVSAGDILMKNLLNLGVNLVATRESS